MDSGHSWQDTITVSGEINLSKVRLNLNVKRSLCGVQGYVDFSFGSRCVVQGLLRLVYITIVSQMI